MTPAETMQIEAIRTSALGVFHAARGLMQALDVMLVQKPDAQPQDDDATFDDSQPPELQHGTQQTRKRR